MSFSERVQVLMTPEQRRRVERIARQRGLSVGAVVRAAVDAYAGVGAERDVLSELFSLELPVSTWPEMKQEIIDRAGS